MKIIVREGGEIIDGWLYRRIESNFLILPISLRCGI